MQATHRNAAVVLFLIGLFVAYAIWGLIPNPRMTLKELGGLTPDEVIARVGPPIKDPRKPDARGRVAWTAEKQARGEDGPLTFWYDDKNNHGLFPYRWGGHYYTVVFENNRVVQVRRYVK